MAKYLDASGLAHLWSKIKVADASVLTDAKAYTDAEIQKLDSSVYCSDGYAIAGFEFEDGKGVSTAKAVKIPTAGNGLLMSDASALGIKIASGSADVLSVSADGLAINLTEFGVKGVDSTKDNGVYLTLDPSTANVKVNVDEGSVASGNTSVVTGGAVYTAIRSLADSSISRSDTASGVKVTLGGSVEHPAVDVEVTPGSVAANDSSVVTGGAVYQAIAELAGTIIDSSASESYNKGVSVALGGTVEAPFTVVAVTDGSITSSETKVVTGKTVYDYIDGIDDGYVHIEGDETITGTKTFTTILCASGGLQASQITSGPITASDNISSTGIVSGASFTAAGSDFSNYTVNGGSTTLQDALDAKQDNIAGGSVTATTGKYITNVTLNASTGALDGSVADLPSGSGSVTGNATTFVKSVSLSGHTLTGETQALPVTGVKNGDKVLGLDGTNLTSTLGLTYDSTTRKIILKGVSDASIAEIDASDFVKDGMLWGTTAFKATATSQNVAIPKAGDSSQTRTANFEGLTIGNQYLAFCFTDGAASPQYSYEKVDLTSSVKAYNAGNGINIDGATISAVLDPSTDSALSLGTAGIKLDETKVVHTNGDEMSGAYIVVGSFTIGDGASDVVIDNSGINAANSSINASSVLATTLTIGDVDTSTWSGVALSDGTDLQETLDKKADASLAISATDTDEHGITVTLGGKVGAPTIAVTSAPGTPTSGNGNYITGNTLYTQLNTADTSTATYDGITVDLTGTVGNHGIAVAVTPGTVADSNGLVVTGGVVYEYLSDENMIATGHSDRGVDVEISGAINNPSVSVTVTSGSVAASDGSVVTGGTVYSYLANTAISASGSQEGVAVALGGKINAPSITVTVDDGSVAANDNRVVLGSTVYDYIQTIDASIDEELAKKADKVANATAGDFAALDASGNLTDSGKKDSDYVHIAGTETIAGTKTFSNRVNASDGISAGSVTINTSEVISPKFITSTVTDFSMYTTQNGSKNLQTELDALKDEAIPDTEIDGICI